ncbi:MAG: hypothetical protein E7438_01045 [Ruminococcaceae bacterium]|nr:hypothetical protein [Oscillospiraceae bacterium]
MYQVGQMIVYSSHGVCSIVDLVEKRIDRKNISYYVLEPVDQPGTRYYLPSENPVALAKSRPLCTKNDLLRIVTEPIDEKRWIAEDNRRRQYYRELVASADMQAMVQMVRCLRLHRQTQLAQGKKFHMSDDNFLRDAKRILTTEFITVLQISGDELEQYLQSIQI